MVILLKNRIEYPFARNLLVQTYKPQKKKKKKKERKRKVKKRKKEREKEKRKKVHFDRTPLRVVYF